MIVSSEGYGSSNWDNNGSGHAYHNDLLIQQGQSYNGNCSFPP
jgi:hypothetical protein